MSFTTSGTKDVSDNLPADFTNRVMALCIVSLEDGMSVNQIHKLINMLPDDKEYMNIEFHQNNSSAYGFIEAGYFQQHDYDPGFIAGQINAMLEEMALESADGIYLSPDGKPFFMGYISDDGIPQTETATQEKHAVKVWLRLGVSLYVTEENGKKILTGDGKALEEIIKSPNAANYWKPDGETYIPAEIMEKLGYGGYDLEFHLPV